MKTLALKPRQLIDSTRQCKCKSTNDLAWDPEEKMAGEGSGTVLINTAEPSNVSLDRHSPDPSLVSPLCVEMPREQSPYCLVHKHGSSLPISEPRRILTDSQEAGDLSFPVSPVEIRSSASSCLQGTAVRCLCSAVCNI
jgi:hypothetical protein